MVKCILTRVKDDGQICSTVRDNKFWCGVAVGVAVTLIMVAKVYFLCCILSRCANRNEDIDLDEFDCCE